MTNEQLTEEVMHLNEFKAKSEAEHKQFWTIIKEIQEDVKTTKNLAEDVHIMAINMKRMQETLDDTNKKVDAITSKEFVEYKENKKLVKQNIISKLTGVITGAVISAVSYFIGLYFNK